jgi:hypothetical protein
MFAGVSQALKLKESSDIPDGTDDCMKYVSEGVLNLLDDNGNGAVDREEFQIVVDHAGSDLAPIMQDIDAFFESNGNKLGPSEARAGFESILKHFEVPEDAWCGTLEEVAKEVADAKWGPEPDHHDEKYSQYEELFNRVFDKLDKKEMDGKLHHWEFAAIAWELAHKGAISEDDAMQSETWFWDNHGDHTDRDGMANALIGLAEHEGEEMVADILNTIDQHISAFDWDAYWQGHSDGFHEAHMQMQHHHHDDQHHDDQHHDDSQGTSGSATDSTKQ